MYCIKISVCLEYTVQNSTHNTSIATTTAKMHTIDKTKPNCKEIIHAMIRHWTGRERERESEEENYLYETE